MWISEVVSNCRVKSPETLGVSYRPLFQYWL